MAQRSEAGAVYVPLHQWSRATRIPRAAAYDQVISKLQRLPQQLGENWDSYGGHPVPATASQRALAFITALLAHLEDHPPAPEVGPAPAGGVILRWITAEHEVELEFLAAAGEYTIRERRSGEVVDEGEIGRPESLLRDVIKEYVVAQ